MNYFTLTLTLLLIMNPLGNAKQFLSHVEQMRPSRQKKIVFSELFYSLLTMFFFSLLGEWLFNIFSISNTSAYLASGLILFLTAMRIIFPKEGADSLKKEEEPRLYPIAIPLIASPALVATIMLYASTEPSAFVMNSAIVVAWLITAIIYCSVRILQKIVGASGLLAFERLMGMILILLAVQRFMEGVLIFAANKP